MQKFRDNLSYHGMHSYILVRCDDLPVTNNGEVTYTSPRSVSANLPDGKRYTGTIATYNCLSGYQLVGGSSLRACGDNGEWNGTAPSCGKYCQCMVPCTS